METMIWINLRETQSGARSTMGYCPSWIATSADGRKVRCGDLTAGDQLRGDMGTTWEVL